MKPLTLNKPYIGNCTYYLGAHEAFDLEQTLGYCTYYLGPHEALDLEQTLGYCTRVSCNAGCEERWTSPDGMVEAI